MAPSTGTTWTCRPIPLPRNRSDDHTSPGPAIPSRSMPPSGTPSPGSLPSSGDDGRSGPSPRLCAVPAATSTGSRQRRCPSWSSDSRGNACWRRDPSTIRNRADSQATALHGGRRRIRFQSTQSPAPDPAEPGRSRWHPGSMGVTPRDRHPEGARRDERRPAPPACSRPRGRDVVARHQYRAVLLSHLAHSFSSSTRTRVPQSGRGRLRLPARYARAERPTRTSSSASDTQRTGSSCRTPRRPWSPVLVPPR